MFYSKIRFYLCLFVFLGLAAAAVSAQKSERRSEFCTNDGNWSYNGRASVIDLRETTIAAPATINVDGKKNGGIVVRGTDRSDVLVRACVQAWGATNAEAEALARSIRVATDGTIRAETESGQQNWGVSYEILAPRVSNLNLTTRNGGIVIDGVDGRIGFTAENGGINLFNPAGDVKGKTKNGGVTVRLEGSAWKGSGLDVETTNGGVRVAMSPSYAARIETGTVNGGFSSSIPGLQRQPEPNNTDGWRRSSVSLVRDLNGGGAPVRIVTVNGGVKIEEN